MKQLADEPSVGSRRVARPAASWFAWGAVGCTFGAGLALRLWYLTHQSTNSDNAVVGLMAQQALHGHFTAFYWGQAYGGVEPYVAAALFALVGQSSVVLSLTPVLLSLVAALLTWRIVLRLSPSPLLALGSAGLVWVFPQVSVWNSTREMGFHEAVVVCGLVAVLCSLRMLDGKVAPLEFAWFGLAAGLGWWSSPEVVYFLVPAGLCLLGAVVVTARRGDRRADWAWRAIAGVGAFFVGALPWLWANAHSHLASLRAGTFEVPPGSPGYLGRLGNFFVASFPLHLNLREPQLGLWWHDARVAGVVTVTGAALAVSLLALAAHRGGRNLAFVVAVIAFPFVQALVPGSWSWIDGRYTIAFTYLLVIAASPGAAEAARLVKTRARHHTGARLVLRVLFGLLLLGLTWTSVHSFEQFRPFVSPSGSFFSAWGEPDRATAGTLRALERAGVTDGYADYWAAYRLDYLSRNRLHLTTAPPDTDRWTSASRQVARNRRPAWIFVPLTPESVQQFQNTGIVGPGGWTLTQFEQALHARGIGYRVRHAGMAIVVVPDVAVTPQGLRAPPSP